MNEIDVLFRNILQPFLPILVIFGLLALLFFVSELSDTSSKDFHDIRKDPELPPKPEEESSLNGCINLTQNTTTVNHITVNNIINIDVTEDSDHEH